MKKSVLCTRVLLIALMFLLISQIAFASPFYDIDETDPFYPAVERLSKLGILGGYGDGSFGPCDYITRAQLAKIAVTALGKSASAINGANASLFTDVPNNHWALGYINYAANSGLITGLPDGTYRPDEYVNYGQALTIIVRMLGYTAEDVGYHWPQSYIEKARALGLINNLKFNADYYIDRKTVAYILDNALFTDMKSTDARKAKLITMMELSYFEDAVIYANQDVDKSLESNQVATTSGTFKKGSSGVDGFIGRKADLVVDKNNEIVLVIPKEQNIKNYIVDSIIDDEVTLISDDGKTQVLEFEKSVTFYKEGQKSSFGALKSSIVEGDKITIYSNDGKNIDYAFLFPYTMEGPYTIYTDYNELYQKISINPNTKVYRDGLLSSITDLQKFDVVYYSSPTNTIYAYKDKVTGVYEKAYPIKANVTSVSVSGITYQLATKQAINKLNESPGAFKIGDKVTLLLGKDGQVVDVVDMGQGNIQSYGVIIDSYEAVSTDEDTKGANEYRTDVFMADGTTVSLKTDKLYENHRSKLVEIDYKDGLAVLNVLPEKKVTGIINRNDNTIGGHKFAKDYAIIELVSKAANNVPTLRKIEMSDISTNELSTKDVINTAFANEFDDILILYVNDVSKSTYQYGILTDVVYNKLDAFSTARYGIITGGVEKTYISDGYFTGLSKYQPVMFKLSGNTIERISNLVQVGSGTKLQSVADGRIKINDTVYEMDLDVQVYEKSDITTFKAINKNSLKDYSNFELYSDTSLRNGGKVRVIIVTK